MFSLAVKVTQTRYIFRELFIMFPPGLLFKMGVREISLSKTFYRKMRGMGINEIYPCSLSPIDHTLVLFRRSSPTVSSKNFTKNSFSALSMSCAANLFSSNISRRKKGSGFIITCVYVQPVYTRHMQIPHGRKKAYLNMGKDIKVLFKHHMSCKL